MILEYLLRASFANRPAGDTGLTEPASVGTPPRDLYGKAVMYCLHVRKYGDVGKGALSRSSSDAPSDFICNSFERINGPDRPVMMIFYFVEGGDIHPLNL